jgi:hypothetical protein
VFDWKKDDFGWVNSKDWRICEDWRNTGYLVFKPKHMAGAVSFKTLIEAADYIQEQCHERTNRS